MSPDERDELDALRARVTELEVKTETLRKISWNLMRLALSASSPTGMVREEDLNRVSDLVLSIGDQIVAIDPKADPGG